jgi:hypothetical protein
MDEWLEQRTMIIDLSGRRGCNVKLAVGIFYNLKKN